MKSRATRFLSAVMIVILMFFSDLSGLTSAFAATSIQPSTSVKLNYPINEWTMDEGNGYIYAVSTTSNKLLFIKSSDLSVSKTIDIGSAPSDVKVYQGKLYIADSQSTFIKIVDIATQSIVGQITTSVKPYRIAVADNKLFYTDYDQWCSLYSYNLSNGQNTQIMGGINNLFYEPDLAVNEADHLLYVGESGISGGHVFSFDTITEQSRSKTAYDDGYGFPYPLNKVIFDAGSVYYAFAQLDKSDLSIIKASYPSNVIYVKSNYVFTRNAIYDKNTYQKLDSLPFETSNILMDNLQNVYLYNISNQSISKITPNLTTVPSNYPSSGNVLSLNNSNMIAWVTDESHNDLYAVTNDSKLLYINKANLQVENQIQLGSSPSDITLYNNKLYVSLNGTTGVDVIDTVYGNSISEPTGYIEVHSTPSRVEADDNNIYTIGWNQWQHVRVTSIVYGNTTVLPQLFSSPDLLLDRGSKKLFIGEDYNLHLSTVSTATYSVISDQQYWGNYGNKQLVEEDGFLYYGGNRIDPNVTSTIYGNYGSSIIYAKGKLVFSNTAIYDRDSFSKLYEFPFNINAAYVDDAGNIYVGELTNGISSVNKYTSLTDMTQNAGKRLQPGKPSFTDYNTVSGKILGNLVFSPAQDENAVNQYQVFFVDQNNNKIGYSIASIFKSSLVNGKYTVLLNNLDIPQGARKLAVFPFKPGLYSQDESFPAPSTIAIFDNPNDLVKSVVFTDQADSSSEISGSITWVNDGTQHSDDKYAIYFADNDSLIGDSIGEVQASQTSYSFAVPEHTAIPQGAIALAIIMKSPEGDLDSWFRIVPIAKRMTLAPTADQIIVVNNPSGTNDTVTVNNLYQGDLVKVFDYDGNLIGKATVSDGQSSVTLSIQQLDQSARVVFVTVTSIDKAESLISYKEYPSESQTTVGGGGVIGGAGGGGGGGGGTSFPVLDAYGRMTYNVHPGRVDMLVDLAKEINKQLTLDATAKQHLDITTVSFDADIFQIAADKGKPISIKTNDVQLTFPVNALVVNNKDDTVKFKLSTGEFPTVSNFNAVSPLLEFTLTEQDTTIATFNSPIEAVFHYDPSKVKDPSNKMGVYWLNEADNTWTYMGGTVNGDGTITASLPHFSKYAVLENIEAAEPTQTGTFADIQGHWAQKDIQQLVSQQIIDGMDASSFQPNNNMTRAQFVTILKKALNLSIQEGVRNFADVSNDSWYKDAVYAAFAANIATGTGDNTFDPESSVTREQLAVMMVNAYLKATGKKLSDIVATQPFNYADASNISDWAKQYVAAATTLGLLNGMDDTQFAPAQNSTRAQVATVVVRMLKLINATK